MKQKRRLVDKKETTKPYLSLILQVAGETQGGRSIIAKKAAKVKEQKKTCLATRFHVFPKWNKKKASEKPLFTQSAGKDIQWALLR